MPATDPKSRHRGFVVGYEFAGNGFVGTWASSFGDDGQTVSRFGSSMAAITAAKMRVDEVAGRFLEAACAHLDEAAQKGVR